MIDILHTKKTVWMHCNRNYPMLECNNWNDHRNESLVMLKSNAHMQIKCLFYRSFWTHRITAHFFHPMLESKSSIICRSRFNFIVFRPVSISFFLSQNDNKKRLLILMRIFFLLFLTIILTLSDNQKMNTKKTTKSGCFQSRKNNYEETDTSRKLL